MTTVSEGLFWSVPFVLATSLATFNNTLRIFDRIEEVVRRDLHDLPQSERLFLNKAISATEDVTAGLLVNSLIVIVAGIAYFVIGAFLSVSLPRWTPHWIHWTRPDAIGIGVRFGLGVLAARVLLIQFQAIPPMVKFYRFFAVDRHLRNHGVGDAANDEKQETDEEVGLAL